MSDFSASVEMTGGGGRNGRKRMVEMAGGVGEMTGRDDDDGGGRTGRGGPWVSLHVNVISTCGGSLIHRHLDLRHKCLYREISSFSSVMAGKMRRSHR